LIEKGARLTAVDDEGNGVIMIALMRLIEEKSTTLIRERTELLKFLVEKGADIRLKNKKGVDAITIAKKAKRDDIVQMLQSGA
jgi:hypothetical protein